MPLRKLGNREVYTLTTNIDPVLGLRLEEEVESRNKILWPNTTSISRVTEEAIAKLLSYTPEEAKSGN